MKPQDLIKKLELLQEDADVVVEGYQCDILADYQYTGNIIIDCDVAVKDKRGVLHAKYSNYANGIEVPVFVIRFGYED